MSASAAGRLGHASARSPLISSLFFLTPLLTAVAPRLAPFMLPILAATLIGVALRRGMNWRALIEPNQALVAIAAFAAYAFLSAIWAANPAGAMSKSVLFLLSVLVAFAATSAFAKLKEGEAGRAARWFLAGSLCGAVFVLIELLTAGALTRFGMNWVSALKPDRPKHVQFSNAGLVKRINVSEFNQHVAMLAFQLFPGLLALTALESGRRRMLLIVLYFCTLAIPIAISEHDSSQVGIVTALAALLLVWKWPRQGIAAIAALWCVGFILVLPLDFLAFRADLHQADWLPKSARARVIIWEYTAEQVIERPVLGIGADSTATVKAQRTTPEEQPEGFVFRRTTGQHAHNAFLQTWYELGIIGAILFAIAGSAVAFRILLLPRLVQPFAAASFMMFATVSAFAWGIWQVWLICAVALMPLYLGLGSVLAREESERRVSPEETPAAR